MPPEPTNLPDKLQTLCRRLRKEALLPAIREFLNDQAGIPADEAGIEVADNPVDGLFGVDVSGLAPFRLTCMLQQGPCGRATCSFYVNLGNRPRHWRQAVTDLSRWFGALPARMLVEPQTERAGALVFAVSQAVSLRDADLVRELVANVMAAGFRLSPFIDLWLPDVMDWETAAYVHGLTPDFTTADLGHLVDVALASPTAESDVREACVIALALGRNRDAGHLISRAVCERRTMKCYVGTSLLSSCDNTFWTVVGRSMPQEDRQDILELWEEQDAIWPRDAPVPSLARLFLDSGRHQRLLDLTREVAVLRPYPLGWFRGQALLALERPDEARIEFEACLGATDPDDYRMQEMLVRHLGTPATSHDAWMRTWPSTPDVE